MLNFAEQTGSGAVMLVWSFLEAKDAFIYLITTFTISQHLPGQLTVLFRNTPSPAKPSQAQSSPVQSSPAQPSPAQPSPFCRWGNNCSGAPGLPTELVASAILSVSSMKQSNRGLSLHENEQNHHWSSVKQSNCGLLVRREHKHNFVPC